MCFLTIITRSFLRTLEKGRPMPCDAVIAHSSTWNRKKCDVFLFQHVPCQGIMIHEEDVNIRLRCAGLYRIWLYPEVLWNNYSPDSH